MMNEDLKMQLYWLLPVRFQEAALSIFARKLHKRYYGDGFVEWKEWLLDHAQWTPSYIHKWTSQQLIKIVEISANSVPFYRNSFKGTGWEKIRTEQDLHILPILDKQAIRQNEHEFIADGLHPESLWLEKTSGTTGTYLKIYWPMSMVPKWWAIMEVMVRYVAGVAQEMPRAMMGGRPVVPGDASQPPFWRFNRYWNQLYFSSYHISGESAADYISALKKYKSMWLTGYGSAIAALAESALDAGLPPHPLKAVIVSGDTLLPGMRMSIEEFFQCKCFDHYGQCEGAAMAMECTNGKMHVVPMLGIIEILRDDGTPCEPGEIGGIVATGLLNDAMPLIRYRIGDSAAWAVDQTCTCGNPNRIIENVSGRQDDYLVTADGRKIGRLAAFRKSPTIHSAQLVQDAPGHAFLLIRPGKNYKKSHAEAICDSIRERIGEFELDIVEVTEIPKTLQGKTRLVIRLMDQPELKEMYRPIIKNI